MSNARFVVIPLALALLVVAPLAGATPEAWARSYSLETQGNSRGALEALESLPEAEHAGYLFTLRHGWLLYLAGRYDASVAAYRQAAALTTESLEAPLGELIDRWLESRVDDSEVEARSADLLESLSNFTGGPGKIRMFTQSARHLGHQLSRLSRLPQWQGRIEKITKREGGRIRNQAVNYWRLSPLRTNAE
ncbi:MAG: hypothetical protein WCQ64_14950 [Acidobacteriota bacterium]